MPSTPDVSKQLAAWIVTCRPDDIPAAVRKGAERTFFNWFDCALGGAKHETVDVALKALGPSSGELTTKFVMKASQAVEQTRAAELAQAACGFRSLHNAAELTVLSRLAA